MEVHMGIYIKLNMFINREMICLATSKAMEYANHLDFWETLHPSDPSVKYVLTLCSTDKGNFAYREVSEKSAMDFFQRTRP